MFSRKKSMIRNLTENQKNIRRRLLKILHTANSSHIGSCLNVIDLIDGIYAVKKKDEVFILSNGHAAAAQYIILEKYKYLKKPDVKKLGFHPNRNPQYGIDVSTGSLGQGLPIAVGMALADRRKNVYCIVSDGECAEGSIWESLRIVHDLHINNLKIIVSANGWGAYDPIFQNDLLRRLKGFGFHLVNVDGHSTSKIIQSLKTKYGRATIFFAKTSSEQLSFLKGNNAHYYIMDHRGYAAAIKELL
jgi:transketolase